MKTILVDAAGTFVLKDEGINSEMYAMLETFPNPKIILTNANDEQFIEFGLTDLPYPIFTLKHNPDKVDPIYFQKMLDQFNLKPEDVIYFEHDENAVKSAESVGIKTYHYDSEKRDLIALKTFLEYNLSTA